MHGGPFIDRGSLSPAARAVWAKSPRGRGTVQPLAEWLPLYQHLDDASGVAGKLWDEWVPPSLKETLRRAVGSEDAPRELLMWLAGVHDIGKASPAFAVQVDVLADDMREARLVCDPRIKGSEERSRARHELVGYLAVGEWLGEHGFERETARALASVVAAHHGRPATAAEIRETEPRAHLVGAGAWADVRRELLAAADAAYASDESRQRWREAQLTQPLLVVLSGLVIVADWIASSDLFELSALRDHPARSTAERVETAWRELDFPKPWRAAPESVDVATLLATRFPLPPHATPHASQRALVEMAATVARPELMILESEMGSGKTEAALLAAETLAARFGMSGIFVGLPTQATADGMFSRVLRWADRLGLDTPSSVFLARSRASLNRDFSKKTREACFRSISDDEDGARPAASGSMTIAHRWFSQPRRGPLSNFVVGTVDQALFAGLRSRYVMLRHLALASKVVLIDEVHAYDVYMQQYLLRVIEWLGAYGVPVILLSATLPSRQREQFIAAYDRGREGVDSPPDAGDGRFVPADVRHAQTEAIAATRYAALRGEVGYPSISRSSQAGPALVVNPVTPVRERVVQLERLDDDVDSLVAALRTGLREGGCAAVVCNTVRRAQERVVALRDAFADDPEMQIMLTHSRFLGVDRAAKDQRLLHAFGRKGKRPKKSIVVATQVIEQSLDIDFDLMATDVAPIDLLLQRSGRLHRHNETVRPAPLREPRLLLTGANWAVEPPAFDSGTLAVYPTAILLRTVAMLRDRDAVVVPRDIPTLVETVYGDRMDFVPPAWRDTVAAEMRRHVLEQSKKQDDAHAGLLQAVRGDRPTLIGWVDAPDADPELTPPGRATVRDTEETLEVIVLLRDESGAFFLPGWVPGGPRQIPANEPPDAALTREILGCTLRLPAGMCRGKALDRHIRSLERAFDLPAWHASHALKGELVLALDARGCARLNEFDLTYSADEGLRYTRRPE